MFLAVVSFYEVKNWTPDLRTTNHFHRTRDDPPACPNAPGHPVAVEVVNFPYSLTIKYMATRLIPSLILDRHAETQLQILAFRAAFFYGRSPHTKERKATLRCTLSVLDWKFYCCSKLRMFCLDALACASIAVAAWLRICSLASCVVSSAKSASSIPPLAADRLAEIFVRLLTVWFRRLDTAPSSERWMFTVFIAASILATEARALSPDTSIMAVCGGGFLRIDVAGITPAKH